MNIKKIKIALVGCGRISKNHFIAIKHFSKYFELVAICDNNSKTLNYHKNYFSIPGYLDLKKMINAESIDLLSICTPSGLHAKQTILAAKKNMHIVVEKPMALKWDDGLSMVQICKKLRVNLFVVKQNRFNPTLQILKRAIDEKRFGKIHMVQVNVFWSRPQSYYNQGDGWRKTKKLDGGAFMNQASHYVDLLIWLIGPVKKVQSMMSTFRKIEVADTGVLNLQWVNGTLGSMSVTMLTYPNNLEGSITILGEYGTVKIGGTAVNEIITWKFKNKCSYDKNVNKKNYEAKSVYGHGHLQLYKNIIDVFHGKKKPYTDGAEGLKSLELLIASHTAYKNKKIVTLPLDYYEK